MHLPRQILEMSVEWRIVSSGGFSAIHHHHHHHHVMFVMIKCIINCSYSYYSYDDITILTGMEPMGFIIFSIIIVVVNVWNI